MFKDMEILGFLLPMALIQSQSSPHEPFLPSFVETEKSSRKKLSCFFVSLAKWVLKVTMWVVFIAWIAIFFLSPSDYGTDLYEDLVSATRGNLFGETGVALLLYGGPLFIVAFLAVPYLILSDEEQVYKHKGPRFRLWTFPVLVDGPFGVVSAAEMIGILLFIVFVLWAVSAYTVTNFEILPSYGDMTPNEKSILMLQLSGLRFGMIGQLCLAFLFLPIARGSVLLRLIDIPFGHATRYHVWLGHLTMLLFTLHGLFYVIGWATEGHLLEELLQWKDNGIAHLAGVISLLAGLLMWFTSFHPVRKNYFELFFYTHQLYVVFVVFLALHVGDFIFSIAAGGIFLFMLDRFLRFCQSRRTVYILSAKCLPCGTVELILSKPGNLRYNALSFIFLQVRELSWLQWHPFSVSSSPLDGKYHLAILIKVLGGWTAKLRENILNMSKAEPQEEPTQLQRKITASVEGPYGHELPYYLMYDNLVLVAGGIGISPFLAILSDIFHRVRDGRACLPVPRKVFIFWAVKRSNELHLLSTIPMESICPLFSNKLNLEIHIYVTRESEPSLEEGMVHEALNSSGCPMSNCSMSAVVGTGNNIWSGLYVISSTVGFVILVALMDILYINPYKVYAWWYKGLLFVACMIASVITFGGIVVGGWHLWDRRASARDEDDVDRKRPDFEQHDGILVHKESNQNILESSTTIQYGSRPDFEEIFGSICKKWGHVDVGVIVCGPPNLQSSVAKEIRSHNVRRGRHDPIFHFNSHSFDL